MLQVPIEHPDQFFKYRNGQTTITKDLVTIFDVMPVKEVVAKVKELVVKVSGKYKWTRMTDPEDLFQSVLMVLTVRSFKADRATPEAFLNVVTCSEILKIHSKLCDKMNFINYQAMRPAGDFEGGFEALVGELDQGPLNYVTKEEARSSTSKKKRLIKVWQGNILVGTYNTVPELAKAFNLNGNTACDYVKGKCKFPGYRLEIVLVPVVKTAQKQHRKFYVYHPSGKFLGSSKDVADTAETLKVSISAIRSGLQTGKALRSGYSFKWAQSGKGQTQPLVES